MESDTSNEIDCPDCRAEAEDGFCCEVHCADCIEEAAFGPDLPIYVAGEVEGSCPHCKAGINYMAKTGKVTQIHSTRACPVWREVATDWRRDERASA